MVNIKKIIAIILVIIALINMLAIATGDLSITIFWFNLGILGLISYILFGRKN